MRRLSFSQRTPSQLLLATIERPRAQSSSLDLIWEGGGDVRRQVGIPLTCGSQLFRPFALHSLTVASAKSLNRQKQVERFAGVALRAPFHSRRAPGYARL